MKKTKVKITWYSVREVLPYGLGRVLGRIQAADPSDEALVCSCYYSRTDGWVLDPKIELSSSHRITDWAEIPALPADNSRFEVQGMELGKPVTPHWL